MSGSTCKYFEESEGDRSKLCAFPLLLNRRINLCLLVYYPLCMCCVELCICTEQTLAFS